MSQGIVHRFAQQFLWILRHADSALRRVDSDLDVPPDKGHAGFHQRQNIVREILFVPGNDVRRIYISMYLTTKAEIITRMLAANQHSQGGHGAILYEAFSLQKSHGGIQVGFNGFNLGCAIEPLNILIEPVHVQIR
ncbi:MAG: hypothetical protein NTX50_25145 [Candidatus Sumerlaeota bacterium]|nr:hypothetical protein [Candidatus Sumerlaeota bacterium]